MEILKVYENSEFGQVRTAVIEGEPMFCLMDICKALGMSNPTMVAQRLDDDELTKLNLGSHAGETNFITESGLYAVILRSDKPAAKKFRKWVTSEVLPSIRKTGSYNKPLTTAEQIKLLAQGNTELGQRVEDVEKRIDTFETELPLLAVDCDRITNAVKARGTHFLGGLNSNAYHDKSLRQRTYSDIHREVKRQFGVSTYKAIRRNQCDRAVAFISNYDIPFVLQDEIRDCNAQITMR